MGAVWTAAAAYSLLVVSCACLLIISHTCPGVGGVLTLAAAETTGGTAGVAAARRRRRLRPPRPPLPARHLPPLHRGQAVAAASPIEPCSPRWRNGPLALVGLGTQRSVWLGRTVAASGLGGDLRPAVVHCGASCVWHRAARVRGEVSRGPPHTEGGGGCGSTFRGLAISALRAVAVRGWRVSSAMARVAVSGWVSVATPTAARLRSAPQQAHRTDMEVDALSAARLQAARLRLQDVSDSDHHHHGDSPEPGPAVKARGVPVCKP
jgi:hypothetical protein